MRRELMEELGIEIEFRFLFKMKPEDKNDKAFHSVFLGSYDGIINYNEEVAEIKWFYIDELMEMINNKPEAFTPQLLVGLKKYFSMRVEH